MHNNSTLHNPSFSKFLSIYLSEILGYYIIPGTALFGFFINLFLCFILYKVSKFKRRFYNIIFSKILTQTITCAMGMSWQNASCTNCIESKETVRFFKFFILTNFITVLYFIDCFLDILITYDRYCLLINKKTRIGRISFVYIYSIIVVFSIILCSPRFFIKPNYQFELNNELNYSILISFNIIFISSLSIMTLFAITIKVTKALNQTKLLRNYGHSFKRTYREKLKKKMRIRSIIYLFSFYVNIRFFYFIIILPFENNSIDKHFYMPVLDLLKGAIQWYLFMSFALSILIYLSCDAVLRKKFYSTLQKFYKNLSFC